MLQARYVSPLYTLLRGSDFPTVDVTGSGVGVKNTRKCRRIPAVQCTLCRAWFRLPSHATIVSSSARRIRIPSRSSTTYADLGYLNTRAVIHTSALAALAFTIAQSANTQTIELLANKKITKLIKTLKLTKGARTMRTY
jgi:hypothetical protein